MTKAFVFEKFGGPEVLQLKDIDLGEPGPGQLRLRHTAIGFNFLDALVREGKYPVLPELPSLMGTEGAGVIEAIGEGVTGFELGQRVAYASMSHGSYAEGRILDAAHAVVLPNNVSDENAAASMLKGMTTEYLTERCYPVKSGETALVHAAAGGVGLFMCQWLKHLGVNVIAAVGSDDKKDLVLANGAAHAVNSRTEDFTKLSRDVTGGEGVHVVYDSIGPAVWQGSLDALRPRGYYVNYGNASGPLAPIDSIELQMHGSVFFTKASMRYYQLSRADLELSAGRLFEMIGSGAVKPVIGQRYKLEDAVQAQIDVMGRKTTGSTVILP